MRAAILIAAIATTGPAAVLAGTTAPGDVGRHLVEDTMKETTTTTASKRPLDDDDYFFSNPFDVDTVVDDAREDGGSSEDTDMSSPAMPATPDYIKNSEDDDEDMSINNMQEDSASEYSRASSIDSIASTTSQLYRMCGAVIGICEGVAGAGYDLGERAVQEGVIQTYRLCGVAHGVCEGVWKSMKSAPRFGFSKNVVSHPISATSSPESSPVRPRDVDDIQGLDDRMARAGSWIPKAYRCAGAIAGTCEGLYRGLTRS